MVHSRKERVVLFHDLSCLIDSHTKFPHTFSFVAVFREQFKIMNTSAPREYRSEYARIFDYSATAILAVTLPDDVKPVSRRQPFTTSFGLVVANLV